ncbi:DUF6084 family protein [Streptomyces sp. NPDC005438]|uniref:DUF6084 family protein n=1 Tax=Streptomyces sp. NPDC005438 TaxID=3156880 RepID=UPI0033BD97D6
MTATPQARPDHRGGHPVCDLDFEVLAPHPEAFAATPTLVFPLRLTRVGGGPVRSVTLNTTVRVDTARRRYDQATTERLYALFGAPHQWGRSLRPLTWVRATTVVPAFDETTTWDLSVPCEQDAELAATRYLTAVDEGEIPLDFLFSGTVFHDGEDGRLRTTQISWNKEAQHALPAETWRELVERYHPDQTWLRLPHEAYRRLRDHQARQALGDLGTTVHQLLDQADAPPADHPDASRSHP